MTEEELRQEREMFEENIKQQYKILDEREAELDARLEEIKRREAELLNPKDPSDVLLLLRQAMGVMARVAEEIQVLRYNNAMRGQKIEALERETIGDGNGKSLHR